MKQPGKAIGSGIAGATIITLIHEALRQFVPQAPRMERIGMQAVEKILNKTGQPTPQNENILYGQALVGDLISNSAFYGLTAIGKKPWLMGLLTGLGAGIAAVTLPKPLGLDGEDANRTTATTIMTIGLYTLGGVVAAGVASLLNEDSPEESPKLKANGVTDIRSNRSWNLKD